MRQDELRTRYDEVRFAQALQRSQCDMKVLPEAEEATK